MKKEDIINLAKECGLLIDSNDRLSTSRTTSFHVDSCYFNIERFAALISADECKQIAQMIKNIPPLVEFSRNEQGGCLKCGFTPSLAVAAISDRGEKK